MDRLEAIPEDLALVDESPGVRSDEFSVWITNEVLLDGVVFLPVLSAGTEVECRHLELEIRIRDDPSIVPKTGPLSMTAEGEIGAGGGESGRRRRRIGPWSYFLLLLVVSGFTLFFMIRSGGTGDLVGVRAKGTDGYGNPYYFTLVSTYGYLKHEKQGIFFPTGSGGTITVSPGTGAATATTFPLLIYREGYGDAWVAEQASLHYGWILAIECLLFFVLVPSILTVAGRERAFQDGVASRVTLTRNLDTGNVEESQD